MNDAVVKGDEKQRSENKPQEFGKPVKCYQYGQCHEGWYECGHIVLVGGIQEQGELYEQGCQCSPCAVIFIPAEINRPPGGDCRQQTRRNPQGPSGP